MRKILFAILLTLMPSLLSAQTKHADTEKLGMALEYFTYGKYHEALLLFEKLEKQHKLNPRFMAYIGLCHYYEWNYEKATQYLDSLIPQLGALAPHERSVYCYAAAESHFNLGQHKEAIPFYEQVLTLCYDNEKGDAFYRLGFCYLFQEKYENARECLESAEIFYRRFRNTSDLEARLSQIDNMLKGINAYLNQRSTTEANPAQSE